MNSVVKDNVNFSSEINSVSLTLVLTLAFNTTNIGEVIGRLLLESQIKCDFSSATLILGEKIIAFVLVFRRLLKSMGNIMLSKKWFYSILLKATVYLKAS